MSKNRKWVVLSAMVLALGAALFLNWQFTGTESIVSGEGSSEIKIIGEAELVNGTANGNFNEFFATARLERENSRAASLEILNAITANADIDDASRANAATEASALAQRVEQEANIESQIRAKGFEECVVVINDEGVRVMVQSTGLLPAEAAKISDIVIGETGEEISNIRIVEVK